MLNQDKIRVLTIDLSNEKIKIDDRKDLMPFLGGVGIATKLLDEHIRPDLDPKDPEQPIILACGPLETIFPVVTKVCAMFYSPLTKELGESYAGLRVGLAMRFAGYDAIVIKGRAKHPMYLSINKRNVEFKNAEALWGTTAEDAGRMLRNMEPGAGFRSTLRIGQAGERGVDYACVVVDTYRHFGRLGLGAAFGSKLLKALVIVGDQYAPIPKERRSEYTKVYKEIRDRVVNTNVMEKYHGLGTPVNILPLNEMNALPTRNLQASSFEGAEEISGEAFAKETLVRKIACSGCPIGCIHLGMHRRQFADGYEYEHIILSYDYELIFALGSFLGIKNKDDIFALIERVELYGLDAMSTGVLLGWVTEAFAKGLISEVDLGTKVEFGYRAGYLQVMQGIIEQPTELYSYLAKGLVETTKKYGGEDFACILGGLEMPGYHTGYGSIVGFTVGARHSHLDNAGYSMDQTMTEFDREKLLTYLLAEEKERNVLNCLCTCLFSRKVYDLETVSRALHSIGLEWSVEELLELGQRIFDLKLKIKEKLGHTIFATPIPKRFFETETLNGMLKPAVAYELLRMYKSKIEDEVFSHENQGADS